MNPSPSDYSSDRRLDILVLGPMGDAGNEPSTIKLQSALNALLQEDELETLLTQHPILTQRHEGTKKTASSSPPWCLCGFV